MEIEQIIMTAMVFLISIIGFFLKRVIDEMDKTKDMVIRNQAKIELVENNHSHLSNRIDMLHDALKDLTSEIKTLTKEVAKRKINMKDKFLKFIDGIFKDEKGVISSKRFVGVIGALSLIVYSFLYPSQYSNSSVLIMSLGALGISGIEKFAKKQ